ncbi:MAG TPA: MFS transporter [Solirubrobacterales bacterium]|nr:MFS transporter [Solirubrobacterales bacterium]
MDQTGLDRLQHRTIRVLVAAQIFGGGGFFLGFAVSVLLARELTDDDSLIGIPVAIAVAAAALSAGPLGSWMQHSGRRPGLAAGQLCGATGAVCVVLAARADSFPLFCGAMALFGAGNASNLLARYAASDLPTPDRRGRAISTVLLATAGGAILGPNLAEAAGALGDALGVPDEAAPFAFSAVALVISAGIVLVGLRPDPLLAAREAAGPTAGAGTDAGAAEPVWTRLALTGAASMVLANVVMVGIMTMTPIHLDDAGQSLGVVGLVISLHVAGMFLPSPVTGVLVDRVGRLQVIGASGVVLVLAGGLALPSSGHDTGLVIAALVLLGIGWNLGLIGGSTLLTDSIPLAQRARAQGRADLAMGLAGALGSLASGPVMHGGGFGVLALVGGFMGAALVVVALRAASLTPRPAEAG